jgi:hypothetical protein
LSVPSFDAVTARKSLASRILAIAPLGLLLFAALAISPATAGDPAALFATSTRASPLAVDHSAWNAFLVKYVRPQAGGASRFDYKAVEAADRETLRHYISRLEQVDPATLDRPEQIALLANLYNAKTIDIVLDHYPVASIKDISLGGGLLASITGGPWKQKVTKLKGEVLSLDDIEHGILRPVFHDPRVHYALNCASIGCPNLRTEAFTGAKLDAQLDAAARDFINDPRGVNASEDALRVSSIYSWFQEDFGGDDAGVIVHLKKFAAQGLAQRLDRAKQIDGDDYDWKLNDVSH